MISKIWYVAYRAYEVTNIRGERGRPGADGRGRRGAERESGNGVLSEPLPDFEAIQPNLNE